MAIFPSLQDLRPDVLLKNRSCVNKVPKETGGQHMNTGREGEKKTEMEEGWDLGHIHINSGDDAPALQLRSWKLINVSH